MHNKIPIYPIFYLLKGTIRLRVWSRLLWTKGLSSSWVAVMKWQPEFNSAGVISRYKELEEHKLSYILWIYSKY